MNREDMIITLHVGQVYWYWTVTDLQGEHIAHGRALDINEAAGDALRHLDAKVAR